jgi:NAD(P)-dependent dehydrogenase (short-subunit alcohol dehydrogenase family)
MIDLKGHSALITGSTKGVGRAIAESLAEAGANVVIHGRALGGEALAVMDRCASFGVQTWFVDGDLSGPTEHAVEQVFDAALSSCPSIDILVNNAGRYLDVPFLDMTLDRFEQTMRLNIGSGYFLTQRFARLWIERKVAGRVLFIGSVNGRLAEVDSTAYDTSKGGIEMMIRTLAVALAPHNIRVNGLAPGLVRTEQTRWLDAQPRKAAWLAHHTPNGQIPDAAVCGPGAVYLVSDEATHVHGHMLMVDGGMSAWQQPEPLP